MLVPLAVGGSETPAGALSRVNILGGGFDACAAPSTGLLDAWYSPSPFWWVGIYIGGNERACSQPNLSRGWVDTNSARGWGFLPFRVGSQMSSANGCSSIDFSNYISTNASRATAQGEDSASQASSDAWGYGFAHGSMIYYDLEAFNDNNSTCVNAARSFINGWDWEVRHKGYVPGVYGSTCGSALDSFSTLRYVPEAIDGAYWNGNANAWDLPCVSINHWVDHQRIKQYVGGTNVSFGGYALNVDLDCANGPINDARYIRDTGDGCN